MRAAIHARDAGRPSDGGRPVRQSYFLVLMTSLSLVAQVPAAEITVKKSGGDYSSIQDALDVAGPGDTVTVFSGTYLERLYVSHGGNAGSGYLTLRANPGAEVFLSGGGSHSGAAPHMVEIASGVSWFWIVGLNICSNLADNADGGSGIFMEGWGGNLAIVSNRIFEIRGSHGMGITMYGSDVSRAISNLVIVGNEIHDCDPATSEAMVLNGNVNGFTVSSNRVRRVNNIGIDFIGGENGWTGGARNGICSDNRIEQARSSYGGGYAAGIYVDGGRDIVIERNVVSECDMGIEVGAENAGWNTTNITVRANVLACNDKVGLVFGGYDENVGRVTGCRFLNNTIYSNANMGAWQGEVIIQWAHSNAVLNNIVWTSDRGDRYAVYDAGNSGNISNTFDYNMYHGTGVAATQRFLWKGADLSGFTAYQAAVSPDTEAHSAAADPLFLDTSSTNLRLTAVSPAVDAGDPDGAAGGVAPDAEQRIRPVNYRMDMGAFEYPFLELVSSGTIHTATGAVVTSWTTVPGGRYKVECSDRLVPSDWGGGQSLGVATGAVVVWMDSASGLTNRYYRCLRQLP